MKSFDPIFPPDHGPLGIYIHVPFCIGRCNYCAFVTNRYRPDLAERYVDAVRKEIRLWVNGPGSVFISDDAEVDTIYFGGGTPSLLTPRAIAELIEAVRSSFRVLEAPEITIEINPATADRSAICEFRQAGVNRASLGVQSLHDTELAAMGRLHKANQAITTYQDLRYAGFENISVDLIAGFPGQSGKSLRDSLEKAAELQPEHLSIYLLELKSGTKLASMIRDGQMPPLDDDLSADLYEDICLFAEKAGYQHYEDLEFRQERTIRSAQPEILAGPTFHRFRPGSAWNDRARALCEPRESGRLRAGHRRRQATLPIIYRDDANDPFQRCSDHGAPIGERDRSRFIGKALPG